MIDSAQHTTSLPCPAIGAVVERTTALRRPRGCDCCGAALQIPAGMAPYPLRAGAGETPYEVPGRWNGPRQHRLCARCFACSCHSRRSEAAAIAYIAAGQALDIAEALAHRGSFGGMQNCWHPDCRRPQCLAARRQETPESA